MSEKHLTEIYEAFQQAVKLSIGELKGVSSKDFDKRFQIMLKQTMKAALFTPHDWDLNTYLEFQRDVFNFVRDMVKENQKEKN